MQVNALSKQDFDTISNYVKSHDVQLLVLDFNGVLDDYYVQKVSFLRDVIGAENERYLPELLLTIERAYILDRTATIETSFTKFMQSVGQSVSVTQQEKLTQYMFTSRLTAAAKDFLNGLTVPFVIYTSLSKDQLQRSLGENTYTTYTRDQYQEEKPSVTNLTELAKRYSIEPYKVCVVGDGLIDDLMPAHLMGMQTILVSPYADSLVHPMK